MARERSRVWVSATVFIISCSFIFSSSLIESVGAWTPLEGHITEDTTLTVENSPYVLINDVVIDYGVRLTIMPGVHLKFGGLFSLDIQGELLALGTEDRMIVFTSNKLEPSTEDWECINLGHQASFVFEYSLIEYAMYGFFAFDSFEGKGTIENSIIQKCRYGIRTRDIITEFVITNSEIRNNQIGIFVRDGGKGKVTVSGNNIHSNVETGISVAWSGISITDNNIHSNGHNGIAVLGANNIEIVGNKISKNGGGTLRGPAGLLDRFPQKEGPTYSYKTSIDDKVIWAGILIFDKDANLNVTLNSINNNQYGIYYYYYYVEEVKTGARRNYFPKGVAYHNDICSNTYGVNVTDLAPSEINVENNYWGDSSGPYHISLNPTGKGNPVNGDGKNLDFIPFSSSAFARTEVFEPLRIGGEFPSKLSSDEEGEIGVWVSSYCRSNETFVRIGDALVQLVSESGGTFSQASGYTDSQGEFSCVFRAPRVTEETIVEITVTASKSGFEKGEAAFIRIRVIPTLSIVMVADPTEIAPEGTSTVTIQARDHLGPVEGAAISVSCDKGSLSVRSGIADENGHLVCTFSPPSHISSDTVCTITATATREGYSTGQGQVAVTALAPSPFDTWWAAIIVFLTCAVVAVVWAVKRKRKTGEMPQVKTCTNCGKDLSDLPNDLSFCPHCGSELKKCQSE